MMSGDGYVLAFDSDDIEFGRGFEAGLVWAHAFHSGGINALVQASNAEMVLRICETLDMPWRVYEVAGQDSLIHIVLGDAITMEPDATTYTADDPDEDDGCDGPER